MNYKIAKTMLVLCVVYLIGFYVLKFAFPELLLQTITSPTVIRLGEIMNKYVVLEYVLMFISNFLTFFLFSCASSGKFKFNWKQYVVILSATVINIIFVTFVPTLYTHTSISLMFICALACKGKLNYTTISFVLHGYLSNFLTSIRGLETIIIHINAISGFLLALEVNFWLLFLSLTFYFKEKKENGSLGTSVYQ